MNQYDNSNLKEVLAIKEIVSISKDGEKIYEIETGEKLYPENITAIKLNKETIFSNLNTGIEVKYLNDISRNVYVYKYKNPQLTSSATGEVVSDSIYSNSRLKLYPNSGTFKINNANKSYPYINEGVEAIGNPILFSPDEKKEFSHYEYTGDGTNWNRLCENNMSCIFNVSDLSLASKKVKFRTVGKDTTEGKYYSYETDYYNIIPAYVVTFDPAGGTISYNTKIVYSGQLYGELPIVTNGTREFKGWYTETGIKIDETSMVQIEKDHTLTAKWGPQTYIVTLNPNEGSVSPTTINVFAGEQYGTLPTPTRSGHVFTGWYTAASGGTLVQNTTIVTKEYNHTLYARWYSSSVQTITTTTCQTTNLPEGVYYIEIVGGGAGGKGYCRQNPKPPTAQPYYGGNAAKWAGYVYIPSITNASVCVGKASEGSKFGTPANGKSSYIATSSGSKLIEAMGGKSYANKPYSDSVTNIQNGAVQKLVCKNIVGAVTTKKRYKGDGGYKHSCITTYSEAYSGVTGIIKYQYIKTLEEWNNSPKSCPATSLCSNEDCGW